MLTQEQVAHIETIARSLTRDGPSFETLRHRVAKLAGAGDPLAIETEYRGQEVPPGAGALLMLAVTAGLSVHPLRQQAARIASGVSRPQEKSARISNMIACCDADYRDPSVREQVQTTARRLRHYHAGINLWELAQCAGLHEPVGSPEYQRAAELVSGCYAEAANA